VPPKLWAWSFSRGCPTDEVPRKSPVGQNDLGEIGIAGVAAANVVYHVTGVRDLPIMLDMLRRT
jgi:hypothetical protein